MVSPLTTYMVPRPEEVNLLTGESAAQVSVSIMVPAERSLHEPLGFKCMCLGLDSSMMLLADIVFQPNNFPWAYR